MLIALRISLILASKFFLNEVENPDPASCLAETAGWIPDQIESVFLRIFRPLEALPLPDKSLSFLLFLATILRFRHAHPLLLTNAS